MPLISSNIVPPPEPPQKPFTATEAIERAKVGALNNSMSLIASNLVRGTTYLTYHPAWINDYLRVELIQMGYRVKSGIVDFGDENLMRLHVSWSPQSS